ncbi:MAG: hypothetical protein ABSF00_01935 [Candidatus Bathyarchaeia archaeon]|jgi:hypothetical protein
MPKGIHLINPKLTAFRQDANIKKWLDSLHKNTRAGYESCLFQLCDQLALTGSQVKDLAKDNPIELSLRVKVVVKRLQNTREVSDRTIGYRLAALTNYLNLFELEAPRLLGLKIKRGKSATHPLISWELANKIISLTPEKYQPVFKLMQWGLDLERICQINVNPYVKSIEKKIMDSVKEQLENPKNDLIRLDVDGRKGNADPYYIVLPREVAGLLPVRTIRYSDIISKDAVRRSWRVGLKRAGLPIDSKHGPHNLRSCWLTEATKRGLEPVLREFQLGHSVDSLNYQRITQDYDWVLTQFRKSWAMNEPSATRKELGERDKKISELENHNEELRRIIGEDLLEQQLKLQDQILQLLKERGLRTQMPISEYPPDIKELQDQLNRTTERLLRLGLIKPGDEFG